MHESVKCFCTIILLANKKKQTIQTKVAVLSFKLKGDPTCSDTSIHFLAADLAQVPTEPHWLGLCHSFLYVKLALKV